MTDVAIARFRKRLRLPADAVGERQRIDRAITIALESEMFDAALQRAGVVESDQICIRRVQTSVRLNAANDDSRLATSCSMALATAIADELEKGGENVVRYISVRHALLEMASDIARGNIERAWAWRQLGLWQHNELNVPKVVAMTELFRALKETPQLVTHALVRIAQRGELEQFVLGLDESHWLSLAHVLLQQYGAENTDLLFSVRADEYLAVTHTAEQNAYVASVARRVLLHSKILSIRPEILRVAPAGTVRALAAIAVVECEPSVLTQPACKEAVQHVASEVRREPRAKSDLAPRTHEEIREESPESDSRKALRTHFGGLLFLLHGVRVLNLHTAVANNATLRNRSLSWVMRYAGAMLIQRFVKSAPAITKLWNDPAVRAFSGSIHTGAAEPFDHSSDEELAAIEELAKSLVRFVHDRIAREEFESEDDVLRYVLVRDADIVSEAAWIDARFPIALISTRIRRAGLDLNPDWLPCIGTVMRFTYE